MKWNPSPFKSVAERVLSVAGRILSDWLEVKFGGGKSSEEQPDGMLRTLCVTNTLREREQRRVHICIKVGADCSLFLCLC